MISEALPLKAGLPGKENIYFHFCLDKSSVNDEKK
jgi:hypothetical protein